MCFICGACELVRLGSRQGATLTSGNGVHTLPLAPGSRVAASGAAEEESRFLLVAQGTPSRCQVCPGPGLSLRERLLGGRGVPGNLSYIWPVTVPPSEGWGTGLGDRHMPCSQELPSRRLHFLKSFCPPWAFTVARNGVGTVVWRRVLLLPGRS